MSFALSSNPYNDDREYDRYGGGGVQLVDDAPDGWTSGVMEGSDAIVLLTGCKSQHPLVAPTPQYQHLGILPRRDATMDETAESERSGIGFMAIQIATNVPYPRFVDIWVP